MDEQMPLGSPQVDHPVTPRASVTGVRDLAVAMLGGSWRSLAGTVVLTAFAVVLGWWVGSGVLLHWNATTARDWRQ